MITQDPPISDSVTTMLVEQELEYLRLLGSRCTGRGRVVELGCFLGGSTVALLRGLDAGGRAYEPILSYDAFEVPEGVDDRFASWLSQYGLRPGERFRSAFERAIEPWNGRVAVREGWIPSDADTKAQRALYPEQEPIELLFVDVAKAWGVHLSVLRAFGTHLHKGSVLVQQDFFDLQTPWIPLHIWQLRDALEPLDALLPAPTCSFRCVQPVGTMLDELWDESVDPRVIEEAWDRIIEYWAGIIGPDAAEMFHGHAFRLAILQRRYADAVRHGRAYEAWSRSAHSDGSYFSTCWNDLLEATAETLDARGSDTRSLRELIAESLARGPTSERPRPGQRMSYCPTSSRRAVWEGVLRRLDSVSYDRIVLCGGGQHTRWLLEQFSDTLRPRINMILDHQPSVDEIDGIPVHHADAFEPDKDESVLILPSSDSYEKSIRSRLTTRFANNPRVTIWRVYTHEDAAQLTQVRWQYCVESVPELGNKGLHNCTRFTTPIPDMQQHRIQLGLDPNRAWTNHLKTLYQPPEWCKNYIQPHECAFIWDFIEAIRPDRLVEIGTASGVSSAMILHALDRFCSDEAVLLSFDISTHCYFDPTRSLGAAIGEMAPALIDRIRTFAQTNAADAASLFRHGEIDLLLIDAEHANPAPAIDLISLIDTLRPGAWVLLHDIELNSIDDNENQFRHTGAERLFHAWPYEKLQLNGHAPEDRNIGAIRTPMNPGEATPILLDLLRAPWESDSNGVRLAQRARAILDQES